MITLTGVRDFVKSLDIGEHFSVGRIDTSLDKSLGVYSRDTRATNIIPVGGFKNKSYDTKSITVLVHWNNNAKESELGAMALYDAIQNASNVVIDGKEVKFIRMTTDAPIDVTDPKEAVYEYVVQCDFIVER